MIRQAATSGSLWKLCVGVCLQRMPIVNPKMTDIEIKMSELFAKYEHEKSYLSSHEKRNLNDIARAAYLENNPDALKNVDDSSFYTAKEMENIWQKDADNYFKNKKQLDKQYKTPSIKSLNCDVDRLVFLLTKLNHGSGDSWGFPMVEHQDGETLRQSAERLLQSFLPTSLHAHVQMLGNMPAAVHKYKYHLPDGAKQNVKLFFHKAYISKDAAHLWPEDIKHESFNDFAWVNIDSLPQYVTHKRLLKTMQQFIVEI